ncbi:Uncharacterised protein [Vibrio cholerae]|nr:Uncharacterised protein [Vibrio cholerae]
MIRAQPVLRSSPIPSKIRLTRLGAHAFISNCTQVTSEAMIITNTGIRTSFGT